MTGRNRVLFEKGTELDSLITRIVKSSSFGRSALYANLLSYLVECTLSDDIPKEVTIAAHLSGKDKSSQDTSQIRVYIYHLRKKLDQYFKNEGLEEKYILTIPKGGYEVKLTKRKFSKGLLKRPSLRYFFIPLIVLFSISLSVNVYQLFFETRDKSDAYPVNEAFWSDFFLDEKPTLIVLGDLLVFTELDNTTGKIRNIRIPDLNTKKMYEQFKDSLSQTSNNLEVYDLTYTYLIKSSATWVERLTRIFQGRKEFNIRVMSRIDAKDLHDHNIVFMGMQKTAGFFNNYFDASNFSILNDGNAGYSATLNGETVKYEPYGNPDQEHTDFGFIAKYPGPNNNTIFMFGGIWDTATSQGLLAFTDIAKADKIEAQMRNQLGSVPKYFEVLIKVSGIDRVGFDTEVIKVQEIDP